MKRKQDYAKIKAWQTANTDRIEIKPRKELNIPARIQAAIDAGCADSRQEYIIDAISAALDRDGIPAPESPRE